MKKVFLSLLALFSYSGYSANTENALEFYYEYPNTSLEKENICFIGDTGTGTHMQYVLAHKLLEKQCQQIRIPGDIIYPSGIRTEDDERLKPKFFDPFAQILDKNVSSKIYLVMGNHDWRAKTISPWVKVAQKFPDKIFFPNPYYAEVWGKKGSATCFLALDTTPFDTWFTKNQKERQISWLKRILGKWEQEKTCAHVITWGHHPHTSSGKHGSPSKEAMNFLEDFALGRSSLYIAGHDHHLSDEGVLKGTRQLISGAGAQLRPVQQLATSPFAVSKYGFIILNIENSQTMRYRFWGLEESDQDIKALWEGVVSSPSSKK